MKLSLNVRNNPAIPYWIEPFLKPHCKPLEQVPQHSHFEGHEWFFCRHGDGIQAVGQWRCPVVPGQLLMIPAGNPHVFYPGADGCQCDVVMVNPKYLSAESSEAALEAQMLLKYWEQYVADHGYLIDLDDSAARECRRLFSRIRQGFKEYGFGRAVKVQTLIYELLALAFMFKTPPSKAISSGASPDEQIQTVLAYLNNHFYDRITIDEVIKIGGMSRSSFHPRFQKFTGLTFCRYLNRLRLEAVDNLRRDGIGLDEAILHCGFGSRSNYYQQRRNESSDN